MRPNAERRPLIRSCRSAEKVNKARFLKSGANGRVFVLLLFAAVACLLCGPSRGYQHHRTEQDKRQYPERPATILKAVPGAAVRPPHAEPPIDVRQGAAACRCRHRRNNAESRQANGSFSRRLSAWSKAEREPSDQENALEQQIGTRWALFAALSL